MKPLAKDWYKKIWSLDIKEQSWVQNTVKEVDFIIQELGLQGTERILDLACGYGRHALEFARRGYEVVGVDITKDFIEDANRSAKEEGLSASFYQMDIREVTYDNEFDVVLNLADGAIGYLENEEENNKIFDVIAKALRPGGKHFMDIMGAEHADAYYPAQYWDAGDVALSISRFEWNRDTRIVLFGDNTYVYGEPASKPDIEFGAPQRLYSLEEMKKIWEQRGLHVVDAYANYEGAKASVQEVQLMIYSEKA